MILVKYLNFVHKLFIEYMASVVYYQHILLSSIILTHVVELFLFIHAWQDAAYFDQPTHSTGALSTRLATDASNVKGVSCFSCMSFRLPLICNVLTLTRPQRDHFEDLYPTIHTNMFFSQYIMSARNIFET